MMVIRKFFCILNLKIKIVKNITLIDLNFRKNDFTNYDHIKSFIFKKLL